MVRFSTLVVVTLVVGCQPGVVEGGDEGEGETGEGEGEGEPGEGEGEGEPGEGEGEGEPGEGEGEGETGEGEGEGETGEGEGEAGEGEGDGDADGDGLPDAYESSLGSSRFQVDDNDSDGDGVLDGNEDDDGDGLDATDEFALSRLPASGVAPSPLRRDLLIELDAMSGLDVSDADLDLVIAAWARVDVAGLDGNDGVAVHFYRDEDNVAAQSFSGSFDERQQVLRAHTNGLDDGGSPALPLDQMVHVILASHRDDVANRGGEVVEGVPDDVRSAGLFLYLDAIAGSFPQCGAGAIPELTVDEAIVGTLVHELGHVLQLGHDTSAGGGVNTFNVMSVPTSCSEARQRFRGEGNNNVDLGAVSSEGQPGFSAAAAALLRFDQRMSVDTSRFVDVDGVEM